MKRFIEGEDRSQSTLFPEYLDDYIAEDNPVRVIDLFVDELDLSTLGFDGVQPEATGRPAYHPASLLKIYIYGYLNRIQSSRRLERETQRNVELIWLTGRLAPDCKAIADFRRDNGLGIRNVCRRFVVMCRELQLFSDAIVAVDGSKFKAVNNRDKNFTPHKLEQRMRQIDESIERYLSALDTIDRTQPAEAEAKTAHLNEKLTKLKQQMRQLRAVEKQLRVQPDEQLSLTDPDARSMSTTGRGTGIVGYNVQAVADTKHHLIVAHEVVNTGHDRDQLSRMAEQSRDAIGAEKMEIIADQGYYKGPEILACDQAGITAYVPKSITSGSKAEGRFGKPDFVYDPKRDEYRCPAGKRLRFRHSSVEHEMKINVYYTTECSRCALHKQCTTGTERRVRRWEHEAVLDKMQQRLDPKPGQMKVRRRTIEHVFGTLKLWMGPSHFLMRTLPHVRTEMSLQVLAYNLKRVMQLFGIEGAMKALRLAAA